MLFLLICYLIVIAYGLNNKQLNFLNNIYSAKSKDISHD